MGIRSQNNPLAAYLDVFSNTGTDAAGSAPSGGTGLTATGGVISDYTTAPGDVYRAHVFTSSGELDVTALGTFPADVEYLVVAGGGGGSGYSGSNGGGGGGAGGLRTNLTGHPLAGAAFPVSVSPYTVTVGAGGAFKSDGPAPKGVDSVFGSITFFWWWWWWLWSWWFWNWNNWWFRWW